MKPSSLPSATTASRTSTILADVNIPPELPRTNWPAAKAALEPLLAEAGVVVTTEELGALYFLGRYDVRYSPSKLEELQERYADGTVTHLDGISVDYDDWHFNVRPSNTEPLLRLCLESLVSPEDMERRRDEVLAQIGRAHV